MGKPRHLHDFGPVEPLSGTLSTGNKPGDLIEMNGVWYRHVENADGGLIREPIRDPLKSKIDDALELEVEALSERDTVDDLGEGKQQGIISKIGLWAGREFIVRPTKEISVGIYNISKSYLQAGTLQGPLSMLRASSFLSTGATVALGAIAIGMQANVDSPIKDAWEAHQVAEEFQEEQLQAELNERNARYELWDAQTAMYEAEAEDAALLKARINDKRLAKSADKLSLIIRKKYPSTTELESLNAAWRVLNHWGETRFEPDQGIQAVNIVITERTRKAREEAAAIPQAERELKSLVFGGARDVPRLETDLTDVISGKKEFFNRWYEELDKSDRDILNRNAMGQILAGNSVGSHSQFEWLRVDHLVNSAVKTVQEWVDAPEKVDTKAIEQAVYAEVVDKADSMGVQGGRIAELIAMNDGVEIFERQTEVDFWRARSVIFNTQYKLDPDHYLNLQEQRRRGFVPEFAGYRASACISGSYHSFHTSGGRGPEVAASHAATLTRQMREGKNLCQLFAKYNDDPERYEKMYGALPGLQMAIKLVSYRSNILDESDFEEHPGL